MVLVCAGDHSLNDALAGPEMLNALLADQPEMADRLPDNIQSTMQDLTTIANLSYIWLVLFGLQAMSAIMSCAALVEVTAVDPTTMNKR